MAVAYSTIANGGTVVAPAPRRGVEDGARPAVQEIRKPARRHVKIAQHYLDVDPAGPARRATTEPEGHLGRRLQGLPATVYGKTGTAERPGQADQSWYTSTCRDPPRPIVVVVTVEKGGFGAETAAPAARLILSNWFDLGKRVQVGMLADPMTPTLPPIQPASEPPPSLVPREWRLRLDPPLLLADARARGLLADRAQGRDRRRRPRPAVLLPLPPGGLRRRGLMLMYGVSRLDYSRLRELRYPLYGDPDRARSSRVLLATATRGSHALVPAAVLRFQPSELGKLLLVLAVSGFLVDRMRRRAATRRRG